MSKTRKICCISGSILLLVMAIFHVSGLSWISAEISNSNAEAFLKDVFPVLFIHVSIQLTGLAGLGILTIFLGQKARLVLILLSILIVADVALAFYLGAVFPGVLLLTASLLFLLAAIIKPSEKD